LADKPVTVSAMTRLFELAARSLHSAGHADGLYPAQWTALRYLAAASPAERTASKLARFQQMAAGPVNRTVRTLVAKGLVVEAGMAGHHRSKQLDLTDEGRALIARDPLRAVDAEFADMPERDARIVAAALGRIISALHTGGAESAEGEVLSLADDDSAD